MNSAELELLLAKRAKRLAKDGAISAEAEKQVYAELKRDAEGAGSNPSAPWLLRSLLLAAAAVVLFVIWPSPSSDFGRAACQLALLDRAGRPLESVERSSTGDQFRRPEAVLVEFVATDEAFVRVVVVDALGVLQNLDRGADSDLPTEAGIDGIVGLELNEFETSALGDSEVSILLISSREMIPAEELSDHLPNRLDNSFGADRASALQALAHDLESNLGCSVLFESFTLDRR